MKKFYLLCLAMVAMFCLNAGAQPLSNKVIYRQDYSSVTNVTDVWNSTSLPGGLSIIQDGTTGNNIVQFELGANNGREIHTQWGTDFYGDYKNYTLSFQFCIKSLGNNQNNTELAIMGGNMDTAIPANGNYLATAPENCLFDLTQNALTDGVATFVVNGDESNTITSLSAGTWYTLKLTVDIDTRNVEWALMDEGGEIPYEEGSYTAPDGVDLRASGIYYLAGRYLNVFQMTNVKVTTTVEGNVANAPIVRLKAVNGASRTYEIEYDTEGTGEALVYILPGTTTENLETWDNPKTLEITTSGQLIAWTDAYGVESEKVIVEVDASEVQLNAPVATITNVEAGYAKKYKFEVSNTDKPLSPSAFMEVTFTPDDGSAGFTQDELKTGAEVSIPSKGIITVRTYFMGYADNTITINNDTEYEVTNDFNFETMTAADYAANTYLSKGEDFTDSKWLMNYYTEDAESNKTFIFDPDNDGQYATPCFHLDVTDAEAVANAFYPVKLFTRSIPDFIVGIGLEAPYLGTNGLTYTNTDDMTIQGGTSDQFVVITKTHSYGQIKNGKPRQITTTVIKGTDTFNLYRYDTAINSIVILSPKGGATGIDNAAVDNAQVKDDAYYTISGVKVNKPTQKGIYIHNGKKIVVK